MYMCYTRIQEAEESDEDWAVRQWRKYVEYGEMIDQTANTGVRVLVAVTKAGQFGFARVFLVFLYLPRNIYIKV